MKEYFRIFVFIYGRNGLELEAIQTDDFSLFDDAKTYIEKNLQDKRIYTILPVFSKYDEPFHLPV